MSIWVNIYLLCKWHRANEVAVVVFICQKWTHLCKTIFQKMILSRVWILHVCGLMRKCHYKWVSLTFCWIIVAVVLPSFPAGLPDIRVARISVPPLLPFALEKLFSVPFSAWHVVGTAECGVGFEAGGSRSATWLDDIGVRFTEVATSGRAFSCWRGRNLSDVLSDGSAWKKCNSYYF